ncbi:DNA internalization-related competence protein ComEC/Rec2 [Variovorax sp. HJSM1_2]|uniref:DNA internalization-related competence protein ComEC/Rec2 n=1 Tax=Variovorax sp. HJSM1_2 TaxID=3366263 RepID=UPI003BD3C7C0
MHREPSPLFHRAAVYWAPWLLGWALGTAWQLQQAALWSLSAYGAVAVAGCVLMALAWAGARQLRIFGAALLYGLSAAALAFALCGARSQWFAQGALDPALEGVDIDVTGMVVAMPQRNAMGQRFLLEVAYATRKGEALRLPPLLQLSWYRAAAWGAEPLAENLPGIGAPDVRAGQRWRMTVRLKAPHGNRNPFGFDYELRLWEQGVQATGYVRDGPRDAAPQRLENTWRHPVESARQSVRDAIFRTLGQADEAGDAAASQSPQAKRNAGVVAALVVGDQSAIDRADWDVFRATGVGHLISISGLHITMFAWLAAAVLAWGWRRGGLGRWQASLLWPTPSVAMLGGVLLATGYALFSGWGVPAQRTVLMLGVMAWLRCSGLRWPWLLVWAWAGGVVLLVDPWALLQAGFWLSFVAVGVLFASNSGASAAGLESAGGSFGAKVLGGAYGRARALVREQAVVTLALAPLGLVLFQQVSVVGLLANLLAIPWMSLVVTPLAMLGVLASPLWHVAAAAVQLQASVLGWLATWPWAVLTLPAAPLWAGLAASLGALLLVLRLPWGWCGLGLPLLLPMLLWQPARPAPGAFELLAADIGQGNAVLVRTARHSLLFDTGPRFGTESDAGHLVLVPLLRALDERLDLVVVSHSDSDHSGGAQAVLQSQPAARLLSSVEPEHLLAQTRPVERCMAGQQWQWDGIRFDVLHPQPPDYAPQAAARPKPNALSCVLRVSNGRQTALLVGDIEQAQEARLVAQVPAQLRADLLLVPHHGSNTSSTSAFLEAVSPSLAVVQAGYRNRFGHPAPRVQERYQALGIRLVSSAQCGALRWHSAAPRAFSCERETHAHYWQHALVVANETDLKAPD